MKKIFIFMAALATAFSVSAETTYTKVTTTPTDWAGKYLIVCEAESVVFNGAADTASIDAILGPAVIQNITFSGNTLAGTDQLDSAVFTIAATDSTDWPWSIQSASGLYIGHKDADDNGLSAETELKNKCMHTLAISDAGDFVATARWSSTGAGKAFNLQYNNAADQLRFRYYKSGKKLAIQIYKQSGTPSALDETQAAATVSKKIEDGRLVILKNGIKYDASGRLMK